MSELWIGMAIQAGSSALLSWRGWIKLDAGQQAGVSVVCLVIGLVIALVRGGP